MKWYRKQQKKYQDAVKKGLIKQITHSSSSIETPTVRDGDVTCTGGGSGHQQDSNENPDYFDPGPAPKNVYDRGFVENWKEVLFPISLRKEAAEMGGYSRPAKTAQAESVATKPVPQISGPSDKTD